MLTKVSFTIKSKQIANKFSFADFHFFLKFMYPNFYPFCNVKK